MTSCPSCGAEGAPLASGAPCPGCGAVAGGAQPRQALPDLVLETRRAVPRAPAEPVTELSLELAVDPRERGNAARVAAPPGPAGLELAVAGPGILERTPPAPASSMRTTTTAWLASPGIGDVAFDARLLADYGDPPGHWILSPLYAWRVLRRQRILRRALHGRRAEAARAAHEVEDALVAFAERVRPAAEKLPAYAHAIEELRAAEEVLRSRDLVLASEQDAQTARLASVDARLAKIEAEFVQAQGDERALAAEVASGQAALARVESKLRRAESELRTAVARESGGA